MSELEKKQPPAKPSLKEYLSAQKKETKKKKSTKIPLPVKIFLLIPFLIIFCFGIFYIPFIIYQIITGKSAGQPSDKNFSKADQKKR